MSKPIFFSLLAAVILVSTNVSAEEKAPLGDGNFAVKLDYIAFTDSHFDKPGNEDDGLYLGIEGYGKVYSSFYLGGEIGTGTNIDLGGEEITFQPVELNLKYAMETARNLVIDAGAGISYSFVEIQDRPLFGTAGEKREDWLLGGQIFSDLTYKIKRFTIGVNAKYQLTQDFRDENISLSNYRLGMQLGAVF